MITVKDLLQLPVTRDFSVVTGGSALNNRFQSVKILGFAFTPSKQQMRDTVRPQCIVICSLLFADQKLKSLTRMIKKLIELKMSALAYKPVVFKELPDEVLESTTYCISSRDILVIVRRRNDEKIYW